MGHVKVERLHSVFDGMFDGVWLVSPGGRTTYANAAMARLLGSTPADMRNRPITDFLDESHRPAFESFLAGQHFQAGEPVELQFHRQDHRDLIAVVAGNPITTSEGVYIGTMLDVSDVTGKQSMDAQMIQNQRLEAIGEFAGGIAHDFNNLLTSIHGYAELARASLPEDDPIREDLDQVLGGADRASAITRKILAFTRRQILVPALIDPAQVVADLIPILSPLLGQSVTLSLDVAVGHGWILADPTQLEQVIVNLAVNARDAMPFGGTMTISIGDVGPDDPARPDRPLNLGPFVRISVADTGIGMDETTLVRAFDPFFTTKDPGKGTGLGLSAVSGIVAQSGGLIHVDTAPGRGSTFHVDLPRRTAPSPPDRPGIVEAQPSHSGMVLLVEDDIAVRQFVRRVLETAGYTVLAGGGAGPALRALERWGDEIAVLVTDMTMPGMSGLDLAEKVGAERPRIGVVLMSGRVDAALSRGRDPDAVGVFVAKPFTAETLSRAVGRAADDGRRRWRGLTDAENASTASRRPRGTGSPLLSVVGKLRSH